MTPTPLYIDGDFTVAKAVSAPEWGHPFPVADSIDRYGNSIPGYLLTQDFVQWTGAFMPTPLGTLHPDWPHYGLVSEDKTADLGGGLAKWKRTYAAVPVSRTEASSMVYQYPGYFNNYAPAGGGATITITQRLPTAFNANVTLTYDYFVIGTSGGTELTADYSTFQGIPTYLHQRWGYNAYNGISIVGFVEINPPMLWNSGSSDAILYGTIPTTNTYLSWVSAGTLFDSEDSQISRWMGPIFQRVRKQIPAL